MTEGIPINWDKARPFLKQLYYIKECGISPWACFTHACHETAFFKRVIGNHNYFGIKKPGRWQGLSVAVHTHEFIEEKKVESVAEFADWPTLEEALVFYEGLVKRLYPDALACSPCAHCFFDGLIKGKFKWATDPLYAKKLRELYEMIRREESVIREFNLNC